MRQDSSKRALLMAGVLVSLIVPWWPAHGQEPFVDGFDDGDAVGWSQFLGTMSISMAQFHSSTYSLRVMHPDENTAGVIMREGFMAAEGVFEAWFWVDNCYECDAMVAFQALDENNYYAVTCMPLDLDGQATVELVRAVGGSIVTLATVHAPGILHTQEWFKIRVHRYPDGLINVFTVVRGVETHQISVSDNTITQSLPFVLGGWGGIYIDDVKYDGLCCAGRTGDANGMDGDQPSIGDVSVMIDAKFISLSCAGLLACIPEADINQSGGSDPACDDITIGDIAILIDYLFITGTSLGLPNCL